MRYEALFMVKDKYGKSIIVVKPREETKEFSPEEVCIRFLIL
jgi:hypothetical protein